MRCLELHEWMSLKLDGCLAADQEQLFKDHLDDCPVCAQEWELWQDADRLFAGAVMAQPPEGLVAQVMMRVQAEPQPVALGRSLVAMACGLAALIAVLVLPALAGLCAVGVTAIGAAQALPDLVVGLLGVACTAAEAVRLFLWALVNSRTALVAIGYAALAVAILVIWLRVVVFRMVGARAPADAA